jgi:hypothetical protein
MMQINLNISFINTIFQSWPIKIKYILNTSTLLAPSDFNNAFKSVTNKIENKIAEIDKLTKDIENEVSIYNEDNIDEVIDIIKSKVPVETLNCLPQYFQSQKLPDTVHPLGTYQKLSVGT